MKFAVGSFVRVDDVTKFDHGYIGRVVEGKVVRGEQMYKVDLSEDEAHPDIDIFREDELVVADVIRMHWAGKNVTPGKRYCVCCGKLLKGDANRVVEVIAGGSYAVRPGVEVDVSSPGYMGCYDVGPDCAEKYLPGFTVPAEKE